MQGLANDHESVYWTNHRSDLKTIKPSVSLPLGPPHRMAVKMNWIVKCSLEYSIEKDMQKKQKKETEKKIVRTMLTLNIQRMVQIINLTKYTHQNYKITHVFQATSDFSKKILVHKWLTFNKAASHLQSFPSPCLSLTWKERFIKILCSLFSSMSIKSLVKWSNLGDAAQI